MKSTRQVKRKPVVTSYPSKLTCYQAACLSTMLSPADQTESALDRPGNRHINAICKYEARAYIDWVVF